MAPPKTWLAIPGVAIACAAVAIVLHHPPQTAVALAALAAATAACVRAFAGPSPAAAVSAAAAGLLAAFGALDLPALALPRALPAAAAALFAIAELARPLPVDASPLPALGGALVAGVLDPSYIALIPIAGVRLLTGPWSRPRWAAVVPLGGTLALGVAILAASAREGIFADLWHVWAHRAGHDAPGALLLQAGDTLGPMAAVATLAGLALCATRGRYAATAALAVAGSALSVDLVCGSLGVATLASAAMATGVGLARLAATLRWPPAQTFVGATAGFLVVAAPAMSRW